VKPGEVDWIFDALPPSGARRGGDPAKHAFEANLRVFVREVVQNAIDQATTEEPPEVHFRFHDLEGDELGEFLRALRWSTLRRHLEAVASQTRAGKAIQRALLELEKRKKLLVLVIEDRSTAGLTGAEDSGESHFRALCKDTLHSHKQSDGAGGSYGLGKSVLWGFSGLSTVLFNSKLSQELPGQVSPRLIGRTELPSHEVTDPKDAKDAKGAKSRSPRPASFAGSGWFGRPAASAQRAESLWADEATAIAQALHLQRTNEDSTGTSILVLGFRDPTADEDRSPVELAQGIRSAVELEFWPAIAMRKLTTWVAGDGAAPLISGKTFKAARPLIECAQRGESSVEALIDAGDVVTREFEIEIPARRDGTIKATKGHVRMAVRLAGELDDPTLVGQVALFRSPGMVVRYLDQRALVKSSRPFHALVACGTARSTSETLPSDQAIERFLRAAEPPGHDKWDVTETLKGDYERGYKKALDQLHTRIKDTLKSVVMESPAQGKRGPERLRRKFPIGSKSGVGGGGGAAKPAFRFDGVTAHFEAGRWWFRGEVRPVRPMPSWVCELRIAEVGEDGGKVSAVDVETLSISGGGTFQISGDHVVIRTSDPLLSFQGGSALGSSGKRALALEVNGRTEVPRADQ
jgi:hypothetical protein